MKVCMHKDWSENQCVYFTVEGESYFYAESALEVDAALIAEYDAACEAVNVAKGARYEIEKRLSVGFEAEEQRKDDERREEEIRQYRKEVQERNIAKNAAKEGKVKNYFDKYPERAVSGWSEKRRLEKLAAQGIVNEGQHTSPSEGGDTLRGVSETQS